MKNLTLLLAAAFSLGLVTSSACDGDDGANACESAGKRLADRYDECGFEAETGGDGGGEAPECTDALAQQTACLADCAENTTCEVLTLDNDLTDPPQEAIDYGMCTAECQ
jgi:hypothetical protein